MPPTIFLIGYRATGKTSVGRRLAEVLDLRFLDLDRELEQRQGRTISDLVASHGWPYFRALERELLTEISRCPGLVISTGGGAILHQDIWPAIKAAGLVVWLTADRAIICQRLAADAQTVSQRPALTDDGLLAEVEQVLTQREPLYRAGSHLTVDTGRLTIDEAVQLVAAKTREFFAAGA